MITVLELRCYARRYQDRWLARCLDYDLIATGYTCEDAQECLYELLPRKLSLDTQQEILQRRALWVPTWRHLLWWLALLLDVPTLFKAFILKIEIER